MMIEKIRMFFGTLDANAIMSLSFSFIVNNYLAIAYFFLAIYSMRHKMRMLDKQQILDEKKLESDAKKLDVELERLRLENDKLRIENTKLEAEVDTVEINNDKLKLTITPDNKNVNTEA